MKFGHAWLDLTTTLPPALARLSFSYKTWKKRTKAAHAAAFLRDLAVECTRIDVAFKRLAETVYCKRARCAWRAPCGCDADVPRPFVPADILAFAELQRTCVTKICKRYDKKNGVRMALTWLQGVKANGAYAFLGGALLGRIAIDVNGAPECPVCLDADVNVILDCGHAFCTACFDHVYRLDGKKGTLHNLVAAANLSAPPACPVCRQAAPLRAIQRYQVLDESRAFWYRGI